MRDTHQIHSLKQWNKQYGSREKNIINIFDGGFKGLSMVQSECLCGGRGFRLPRHIEYVHNKQKWDGITYFTDKFISPKYFGRVISKIKVAILTEPRDLQPQMYKNMEEHIGSVDLILTHDREFLEKFPRKSRFFICSCPIFSYEDIKIHPKTKLCSMIFSNKTQLTGHALRHEIYQELKKDSRFDFIDYFGPGVGNYVSEKIDTLKDYRYSIVIENNKKDFYFTEKIFDAFSAGNIPIFWGCPSIGNYFNKEGILQFDNIAQLKNILLNISEKTYNDSFLSVEDNYSINLKWMDPDDIAFETVVNFLKEVKKCKEIYDNVL